MSNNSPVQQVQRQISNAEQNYFKNIADRRGSIFPPSDIGSASLKQTPMKSVTSRRKTKKQGRRLYLHVLEEFLKIDNTLKTGDGAYKAWKHMMRNYERAEKPVKSGTLGFGFDISIKFSKTIKLDESYSLTELRPYLFPNFFFFKSEVLYLITICQTKELHEFFIEFYVNFDSNKNFKLELPEFAKIVKVMTNEKNMGMKKFKVFADIVLQENDIEFKDKVDIEIVQELFTVLKDDDANADDEESQVIDYLLFFPFLLSFYFEYSLNEINFRKERFDVIYIYYNYCQLIRGIEVINSKEKEIKNIYSLITLLKEMGIDYFKGDTREQQLLSYRDIENILLKFKNIQKWITFDIIKQIMQQLEKKMKVEYRTKIEKKRMKLYKLINFLALKLCIHQNCQQKKIVSKSSQQSEYLEILVWWHSAHYAKVLKNKGSSLRLAFDEFMAARYPNVQDLTRYDCQVVTEQFFRKHFPLMPKENVKRIVRRHSCFKDENDLAKNPHLSVSEYGGELYEMICLDGEEKIKNYIKKTVDGVNEREKKARAIKQNGEDKSQIIQEVGMLPPLSKRKDSPQNQRSDEQLSPSKQNEHTDPLHKFQKAVHAIQGEQNFTELITDNKKPKDVLKACFIMENFLQRLVHKHKKQLQPDQEAQGKSIMYEEESDGIMEHGDGQPVEYTLIGQEKKQNESNNDEERETNIKKSVLKVVDEKKPEQKEIKSLNKQKIVAYVGMKGEEEATEEEVVLQKVQGVDASKFGPSNIKRVQNDQHLKQNQQKANHLAGHFSQAQHSKILLVANQMEHQDDKPYTADYEFYINEDELEIEVQREKAKQGKQRDNCKCTIY